MRSSAALCLLSLVLLTGCFTADVTVKADGSGTLLLDYELVVASTVEAERWLLSAPGITIDKVKIMKAERDVGEEKPKRARTRLHFTDVTKLSHARMFEAFDVRIEDAGEGRKRLKATLRTRRTRPGWKRTDPCTVRVHLPGKVIESSAQVKNNTVVWTFPSVALFTQGETTMTAVYEVAAAPAQ